MPRDPEKAPDHRPPGHRGCSGRLRGERAGSSPSTARRFPGRVLVVGDLHGNMPAFRRVLDVAGSGRRTPARAPRPAGTLIHGNRLLPRRAAATSPHQLVDVVCRALKCQYPDRVHLIPCGNHELSELTGRSIGKNGVGLNVLFPAGHYHGVRRPQAGEVYAAYLDLFAALPLIVVGRRTASSSATPSPTATSSTAST